MRSLDHGVADVSVRGLGFGVSWLGGGLVLRLQDKDVLVDIIPDIP